MYKDPNRSRLREILSVIHKHNIARGVSPEKIRLILEDLALLISSWARSFLCALIFCRKRSVKS